MLTKDDLEQIAKLITASEKRLTEKMATKEDIRSLDRKVDTVDLKVAAVHEFNKKAHTQIMDILIESGEINYMELKKELKELKKRVEQLESPHKN
jgi:seryl-tRNA synthetase